MQNSTTTAIALLRIGAPPGNAEILEKLSAGVSFVTDFWKEKYLNEYILEGGSKIKFVTGGAGSGKTHFLQVVTMDAEKNNYLTVNFSAKDVWLHDFREIYVHIFNNIDLETCLNRCSKQIIQALGYKEEDIPTHMNFADYLASQDALTSQQVEIKNNLRQLIVQNPQIDKNFGLACHHLMGGMLGYPICEVRNKELYLHWLKGEKEVTISALRRIGLSPYKITKFNARHMLRSLVEVIKLAGYAGLVVTVDDLDILIENSKEDRTESLHYTKVKREDTFESIRELIDQIDTLNNIMFVFAFERGLINDERQGLKSYQALWMRIQDEVSHGKFNKFTDMVDLDFLAEQVYNADVLVNMSENLSGILSTENNIYSPLTHKAAQELIASTRFSKLSLPLQVNQMTIGGKSRD